MEILGNRKETSQGYTIIIIVCDYIWWNFANAARPLNVEFKMSSSSTVQML